MDNTNVSIKYQITLTHFASERNSYTNANNN
mgnify:CR=1 FL=1